MQETNRMAFEMIVRKAFDDCGRYGDPAKMADTDTYDYSVNHEKIESDFYIAMGYSIKALMIKSDSDVVIEKLHTMFKGLFDIKTRGEAGEFVQKLYALVNESF